MMGQTLSDVAAGVTAAHAAAQAAAHTAAATGDEGSGDFGDACGEVGAGEGRLLGRGCSRRSLRRDCIETGRNHRESLGLTDDSFRSSEGGDLEEFSLFNDYRVASRVDPHSTFACSPTVSDTPSGRMHADLPLRAPPRWTDLPLRAPPRLHRDGLSGYHAGPSAWAYSLRFSWNLIAFIGASLMMSTARLAPEHRCCSIQRGSTPMAHSSSSHARR